MKIHTTTNGDRFLRAHIADNTPWARSAYRPPANPLPADRVSRFLKVSGVTAALLGGIALITFLSTR